jgi:hypothetical protein
MTRVELLYFDGCPNHEPLEQRVRELLSTYHLRATIDAVPVRSDAEAHACRFLGSPTLRINGEDVEPGAGERTDFGMKCRLFHTSHGLRGTPAEAWVIAALTRTAN